MPAPVTPPPAPEDIKTVEELYLAGQRIEQFHDPSLTRAVLGGGAPPRSGRRRA